MKLLLKFPRTEPRKKARQLFKVDREFRTKTKATKRTLAISEAFGIGIDDEKRFSIFKGFELEIKPGQVVLITGDSGSGKSTLLREIVKQASGPRGKEEFPSGIVSNSDMAIDPNEVLIEGVGRDVSQAISILSMAGLNEAFLMLRKFKELSDGQKYRYRLAKMIDSPADLWCFDEFAAVLDRTTAKVVSYCAQKTARKLGKTVVLATTHMDLLQDLKADTWVHKEFGDAVRVVKLGIAQFGKNCSLLATAKILECQRKEIQSLEKFHYRGSNPGLIRHVFKATIGNELAAAILYVFPHFALKGRNIALPQFKGRTTSDMVNKINQQISRISRVIVAPKFRSIGLGAEIVRRTLGLAGTKYVETVAVMAKYNPFFEAAGMTRVPTPDDVKFQRAIEQMEDLGFKRELMASRRANMKVLAAMRSTKKLEQVKKFALNFCVADKFRGVGLVTRLNANKASREDLARALTLVRGETVYLYYENP